MRAAIFDIDGTLLDSIDLHAKAWVEAFAHFGVETAQADVRRQIGKDIAAFRSNLFKTAYLDAVRPFPAVRPLFERIRAAGLSIALASSGKGAEVEHYREILGIGDLVDAATSADDADRSKPHPDIFQAAIERLSGIDRDAMMVIGETPYDAQAAAKAGLRTIGMLCGGFPEGNLEAAGCTAIYRDPQHLLDGFEASPLARE